MSGFFYSHSDLTVFLAISVFFVIGSVFLVVCVNYFKPLKLSHNNNAVIGPISALVGVIYGVLVGLTALNLINNITTTSDSVEREANAAANLNRDTLMLPTPIKTNLRQLIREYLAIVVEEEWPLMQNNTELKNKGELVVDKISNAIITHITNNEINPIVGQDMLQDVRNLYDARDQRINVNDNSLNSEMWLVILIGSVLTVAINAFFKINLTLHVLAIVCIALIVGSMVFLILTLDKPFQGEFVIQPTSFKALQMHMNKDAQ